MDVPQNGPRRSQRQTQGLYDNLQRPLRRGASLDEEIQHTNNILAEGRSMFRNECNEREATFAAMRARPPTYPRREETIDEDDLCPVCQQLLLEPVKTTCNHTLCKSCMAHWADVSVTSQMVIVDVDEEPAAFDAVAGLEAKCPMCRQQTTASLNAARGDLLNTIYPEKTSQRRLEESLDNIGAVEVHTMTVYIGNKHHPVESSNANKHEWTFFVKPSRPEMIEEVHIDLHPTLNPPRVIRGRPPYDIRRVGWGTFTITANVILKAGYSWVSGDAVNSPDGAEKGMLPLEWTLDFSGFGGKGSMARLKLKVKAERDWVGAIIDEQREGDGDWRRAMRQYERDGGWNPVL